MPAPAPASLVSCKGAGRVYQGKSIPGRLSLGLSCRPGPANFSAWPARDFVVLYLR